MCRKDSLKKDEVSDHLKETERVLKDNANECVTIFSKVPRAEVDIVIVLDAEQISES